MTEKKQSISRMDIYQLYDKGFVTIIEPTNQLVQNVKKVIDATTVMKSNRHKH